MNTLSPAMAISPIDGRYFTKVCDLSQYFSDFALVKTRLQVEVEYFLRIVPVARVGTDITKEQADGLRRLYREFSQADYDEIQEIEKTTNHDVKSVEVFLKRRVVNTFGKAFGEFVHFGLTSQDINDVAIPYLLKSSVENVILPEVKDLLKRLSNIAAKLASVAFVARTHGQPATPSTFGKEFKVYVYRLTDELAELARIEHFGKFGGATGNFNASYLAYPDVDWVTFGEAFLSEEFGLTRSRITTQINNYESMARIFDSVSRLCGIMQDLSQDLWLYLMLGLLTLKSKPDEVGSSAMPHKVNPISFENAEGNLQVAISLFDFLSRKLLVSRLQRDLTDYTVKRNIGVPMAHLLLSVKNLAKGVSLIVPHEKNIAEDCEKHFVVIAEGIQTILRSEGLPNSYDMVKGLVRGTSIDRQELEAWIGSLAVSDTAKSKLQSLSPKTYLGNAPEVVA